jgi:hypothetical protein
MVVFWSYLRGVAAHDLLEWDTSIAIGNAFNELYIFQADLAQILIQRVLTLLWRIATAKA